MPQHNLISKLHSKNLAVNSAVTTKRVDYNPGRGKIKKVNKREKKMQLTEIGNEMGNWGKGKVKRYR